MTKKYSHIHSIWQAEADACRADMIMTNNPLIAKWEELHNPKKEEPKPNNFISATNASVSFIPKPYTRHDSTIATLEALLEDLKSGRAIMMDLKTQPNCNHLDSIPFGDYTNPILIDRGDKITLEIFRQYD